MMIDPQSILEVRLHLHLGAHAMCFEHRRGTLAPSRVMQLLPTQATTQDNINTHWLEATTPQCRSRGEAAIYINNGASDETGAGASQEDDSCSDFI